MRPSVRGCTDSHPRFGAHTLYNTLLGSLPLFVSEAPGILLQRFLIIGIASLPLLIILISRWRTGRWIDIPHAYLNGAWQPVTQELPLEKHDVQKIEGATKPFTTTSIAFLLILALGSIYLFSRALPFTTWIPSITVTREQAEKIADAELKKRDITLTQNWRTLPSIVSPDNDNDLKEQYTFIWQKYGKEATKQLTGSYLAAPHWVVRYAQFGQNKETAAEEYQISVDGRGTVTRVKHVLPQNAPGERLTAEPARSTATAHRAAHFGIPSTALREVVAYSEELPQRRDWHFGFAQPLTFTHKDDADIARISISLAGKEIADARQSIELPEEWQRLKKREKALTDCFSIVHWLGWFLLLLTGALYALILFKRKQLHYKPFFIGAGLYAFFGLIALTLNSPQSIASFSTAKPFLLQLITFLALQSTKYLLESVIMGLFCAIIFSLYFTSAIPRCQQIGTGLFIGCIWTACLSAIQMYLYPSVPWFETYVYASASAPWFVLAHHYVTLYIRQTFYMLFLASVAQKSSWPGKLLSLAIAIFYFTPFHEVTINQWFVALLIMGSVMGVLYYAIIKADPRIAVWIPAVQVTVMLLKEIGVHGFIESLVGSIVAIACIWSLGYWLTRSLNSKKKELQKITD